MIETGPRLGSLSLWGKREKMYISIIERALVLLREENDLPESECDLNRLFYFRLLRASNELYPKDPVTPQSECNNQPDPDDEVRAAREHKRPDFQWGYRDRYEPDPDRSAIQFTVECKRLGAPSRAGWPFNVKYVENGICRFRDPVWGYGQRFRSGAMVGYWQSMELSEVIGEVNAEVTRHALPEIVTVSERIPGGHRSEHTFDRKFPSSPFRLQHLWIDIRPSQM
jgi:hypothetical protein